MGGAVAGLEGVRPRLVLSGKEHEEQRFGHMKRQEISNRLKQSHSVFASKMM